MLVTPGMIDAALREADKLNLLVSVAATTKMIQAALRDQPSNEREFFAAVSDELKRARAKHPQHRVTMVALTEEVGELAQALMDAPGFAVRQEAVQVAAMAARVVLDGDDSLSAFRADRDLDNYLWRRKDDGL